MESHGLKGRIHVSEATAEELRSSTKDGERGDWLQTRLDTIHAKGKGDMRTYWVTVPGRGTKTGTSNGRSSVSGESQHGTTEDLRRQERKTEARHHHHHQHRNPKAIPGVIRPSKRLKTSFRSRNGVKSSNARSTRPWLLTKEHIAKNRILLIQRYSMHLFYIYI